MQYFPIFPYFSICFMMKKRALQHVSVLNALFLIYVMNKGGLLNHIYAAFNKIIQ